MDQKYQNNEPPEITVLDARIARAGGTTSRLELQPYRLQEAKTQRNKSRSAEMEDLTRENGHLRQEIVFYQESRNAMLSFHHDVMEGYQVLQTALRELSEKMARAESRIERYWGVPLTGKDREDVTVL